MALLYYNDPPNAAGTGTAAENAALALQRLRDGNIVNRFTGERVTETQANLRTLFGGTTITTDTEEIIVNSNRSITASGYFVVRDKSIVFNSATARLTANANDVHIAFFNCNITVLNADPWADYFMGGSPNAGGGNAQIPDGRAISGQTSTRGIHFYGCTFSFQTGTTVVGFQCVDMFNSNVVVGRESGLALPSMTQGSRWINVNFQAPIIGDEEIRPQIYDVPELFEGVVFVGSDPELIGRAGPYPITNPDYPANGQTTALLLSNANPASYSTAANIWQQMGVVTPAGEATANGISRTAGAAARTAYAGTSNNNNGGVIQYYGWNPGYFTDLAQTDGIPFVRVRVGSSAVINTTATGLGQFHQRVSDLGGGEDQTSTAINHVNEFVTDATGRLVRDANTRRSVSGTQGTFTDGYIDWLDLTRVDTAQTGSTTELARNARGFGAPANTALALLFDMRSPSGTPRFDRYQVSFESRSATHEIAETQTIQGNIGTGAGDLAPRTAFPIETPNRTVAPRANFGSMSEAEAMNRFATRDDKTIQNINDFLIASWARYLENGELNLITQNGANAVIDYNITFTGPGSTTADDNVSVTNQDLTITNVDDIIAPVQGDVITGFTTTGNVTFNAGVGSRDTNIGCNDLTLAVNETYSGTLTVGRDLAAASATFATGTVANVTRNLTAANTTWQDGVNVTVTGTTGIAGATIGTDSTTAAVTTLTGTGAITGSNTTVIGNNTTLSGSFDAIPAAQFDGTTIVGGSTLILPDSGDVTLAEVTLSGTGQINVNRTGSNTITLMVPQAQIDANQWNVGPGVTLMALPVAPGPRTFTIDSTVAGKYIVITDGVIGPVQTKASGAVLEIIDTISTANVNYEIIWQPTNAVANIYNYNRVSWNPSLNPSATVVDLRFDQDGTLTGNAIHTSAFTYTVPASLNASDEMVITITSAATTYSGDEFQTVNWQIRNEDLYMLMLANNSAFTNSNRPNGFGLNSGVSFPTTGGKIRWTSATQRFVGPVSGDLLTTTLTDGPAVVSTTQLINVIPATSVADANSVQTIADNQQIIIDNQRKVRSNVQQSSVLAGGKIDGTSGGALENADTTL